MECQLVIILDYKANTELVGLLNKLLSNRLVFEVQRMSIVGLMMMNVANSVVVIMIASVEVTVLVEYVLLTMNVVNF